MKKEHLIKKWLFNTLNESELKDFQNMKDNDLHQKIVEKARLFDMPDTTAVKTYEAFKKDLENTKVRKVNIKPYPEYYRIAALFIVAISVYFLFFFNNLTSIETIAGQRSSFELPDASKVILNASSRVVFNTKKWQENRELTLNGEAYFKVNKGSTFDVKTTNGIVSVLGTQFNVKNRGSYFEVNCFEGYVSVKSRGKINQLTKGESLRFLNNLIVIDTVQSNEPSWIKNISSFKAIPLALVLEECERQYNVEIEVKNIDISRMFTGSFANDDLDQALKSITVPFNLTYKKSNSNKISIFKSEQ